MILLIVIEQAVTQPLMVRLEQYAPLINLAGRQRMLSQRLAKTSLALDRARSERAAIAARRELSATLAEWSAAHKHLQDGAQNQGIVRISSPTVDLPWAQLEPLFDTMVSAAGDLVKAETYPLPDGASASINTIVRHEPEYLATMDLIVKLKEAEANRDVWHLRSVALGTAATTISVIVGLGWFVVRPATHTIRKQVDGLETRVAERTAALTDALDDLKKEAIEREKSQSKIQRLAAQLAHADRLESMGHLAVGLAHELNHPLGTIANYAEVCDVLLHGEEVVSPDEFGKLVVQIRDASLRAGKIVRHMRNFVKPNASETADVDLRPLIDEIVAVCRPELERKQVAISTQLGRRPLVVNVDAIQIQQVLVNLVQNATQAMADSCTNSRHIVIRATLISGEVKIEVVDRGPGFDVTNGEDVFEPFHSTKPDGLGVGLSICRSIIENHHGAIWADTLPDGGAVVSFTLPTVPPHVLPACNQTHSICS